MSLFHNALAIGRKAWRPYLSIAGAVLVASSCGAPRLPTADVKYQPGARWPVQAVPLGPAGVPHKTLDGELAALATNAVSNDVLDGKRGGFQVGGLNLSIGLQVTAQVQGVLQVVTNLSMNDAGQLVVVASRTQTFPTSGTLTAGSSSGPPIAPHTQNQFIITTQPQSGNSPPGGSPTPPTSGPTNFTVVAGDPATTQIIQQVAHNSIATIVSNRVDGATVNVQSVLNVTINNAAALAATFGAITAANHVGDQVSRMRIH